MNKIEKFELMEKIARELEDLKNSQQVIVQKIGKIEVDNIELDNKALERIMPDIHQNVSDNLDKIAEILQDFEDSKNDYEKKNNIEALKEQQAIEQSQQGT